jgi:hypothetical protein
MFRPLWKAVFIVPSLVLLAGCGPGTSTVSGTVTIDGQPLDGGVISLVPAEAGGEPATAEVVQGKYALRLKPGKKHVQISAPQVVGQRKEYKGEGAPLVDIIEERLPPKYNSQTELTLDVAPGASTKDWSVQSLR